MREKTNEIRLMHRHATRPAPKQRSLADQRIREIVASTTSPANAIRVALMLVGGWVSVSELHRIVRAKIGPMMFSDTMHTLASDGRIESRPPDFVRLVRGERREGAPKIPTNASLIFRRPG
jgi:hypothetical protein